MTPALESFHKAKAAARHAVRLQPELGEGYASLAHVRLHDWDWVSLESDFRQAVELDPGYAIAHYWYAEYLMAMGRTREAVGRVEHAWELDPLNSAINASVGIDAMRQAVMHSGGSTEALAGLAQAHAVTGDKPAMEGIVKELGESGDRYVSPYNIARVYGAIGDRQRALEWLERAYREHNPDLIELTREPSFTDLHSDAKFRELVERIGWRGVAAERQTGE